MVTPPSAIAGRLVPADMCIIAETTGTSYIFIENLIE
jgi:hypothetical protein